MNSINQSSTEIVKNWIPSAIIAQRINTLKSDYRGREYRHILTQEREKMTDKNDGIIIESAK